MQNHTAIKGWQYTKQTKLLNEWNRHWKVLLCSPKTMITTKTQTCIVKTWFSASKISKSSGIKFQFNGIAIKFEPVHVKTWPVHTMKTRISLGIRPVWSETSLSTWRNLRSLASYWLHSEDSEQAVRMPRLIWVFTGCTDHFDGFVMHRLICKNKKNPFWLGIL